MRLPATPSAEALLAKALEFGVFAPVGVLEAVRSELPKFAARGRQTVEQRVLVGRFIATLIAQQARQRFADTMRSTTDSAPATTARTPEASTASQGAVRTQAERSGSAAGARAETRVDLAIDHYESLSATQVIPLLASLDPDDLAAIEAFERTHRNRRTVLGRIEQLQSR